MNHIGIGMNGIGALAEEGVRADKRTLDCWLAVTVLTSTPVGPGDGIQNTTLPARSLCQLWHWV